MFVELLERAVPQPMQPLRWDCSRLFFTAFLPPEEAPLKKMDRGADAAVKAQMFHGRTGAQAVGAPMACSRQNA